MLLFNNKHSLISLIRHTITVKDITISFIGNFRSNIRLCLLLNIKHSFISIIRYTISYSI